MSQPEGETIARMLTILKSKLLPDSFIRDALTSKWGQNLLGLLPEVGQYANFLFSMPESARLQLAMSYVAAVHEELSSRAELVVEMLLQSDTDLFHMITTRDDIKAVLNNL